MANEQNLKPFKKGDPRINRKGRPKSFDALRELAQTIAHEPATKQTDPVVIGGKIVYRQGESVLVGGHIATVAEIILRQWATSKNHMLQKAFIEVAFGKVPDAIDLTSKGEKLDIILRWMDEPNDAPAP